MNAVFDLRSPRDREAIADALPDIDDWRYSIPREQFLDALAAVADYLPTALTLEYRYGIVNVYNTMARLHTLVDLGTWLRTLCTFKNFEALLAGFRNPTQFGASHFEAKVAAYFAKLPGVTDLEFSPAVIVKDRHKYPEFLVRGADDDLLVECKRVRFDASKHASKFRDDVTVIDDALTRSPLPEGFCLEVEFLGPEREMIGGVVRRLVEQANFMASAGAGTFEVGHLRAWVRLADDTPHLAFDRSGLYSGTMRMTGQPINAADSRHYVFQAFRGDLDRWYPKLFRAALRDARSQLPRDRHCAVCIDGIPMRAVERLIDPSIDAIGFGSYITMVSFWDGAEVRLYASNEAGELVTNMIGHIESSSIGTDDGARAQLRRETRSS